MQFANQSFICTANKLTGFVYVTCFYWHLFSGRLCVVIVFVYVFAYLCIFVYIFPYLFVNELMNEQMQFDLY